jgi:two-component system OmpR family sensor kinase
LSNPAKPHSLISRLRRTLTVWVGVLWLCASAASAWYVHGEVAEGIDSALIESAERLLDLAVHEAEETGAASGSETIVLPTHPNTRGINHSLIYQIVDSTNRVVLRTSDSPLAPLAATLTAGFFETPDWRVYTVRHPRDPLYIHIADSIPYRQKLVLSAMLWLLLPLLGVLPLLAWLVRVITQRELASVGQVAQQIRLRSGSDMRPIDNVDLPEELEVITASTNHLLARLSEALDIERALAASTAHELRTPLAAARLRLQSALDADPGPALRGDIVAAAGALDKIVRRTEKLLQLSRAGSGAALCREPVDLLMLAANVAQEFWATPAHLRRLRLRAPDESLPPVMARGDVDTLGIALRNLIENALRHSGDATVEIELMAPATLVVKDHGPGVPAEQLAHIHERHIRSGAAAGFGLGLSIVSTIAEKHGGKLVLASPLADGQPGFCASLELLPA